MSEEIRQKMLLALPHFRHAVNCAKAKGKVKVGILAELPDGSGSVEARFDAPEFFDDLAELLGAGPQTEEDELAAMAEKAVQGLRGSSGN